MITYFIKSGICLALLLVFYHLILEREKMHQFNRFYLLGSVLFSFLAPLFIIYTEATVEVIDTALTVANDTFILETTEAIETPIDYWSYFIYLSVFISTILLIRFIRNVFSIYQKTQKNQNLKYKKATLILVGDAISPHTFWNYIFINKDEYYSQKIEAELFTHELTHAIQKHTFDVLLIEVLKIIFWFNPIFYFLKKTIQLNHEFLADTKVISNHKNISEYQYLLLNKTAWNNEYYLASNLNYLLTKKRLLMMTKQSSRTKILFKKLAILPVTAGFLFLFAERVEAETVTNDYLDSEIKAKQSTKKTTLSPTPFLLDDIKKKLKDVNSLKRSIVKQDTFSAKLPNGENIKVWGTFVNKDTIPARKESLVINRSKKTFTYKTKDGKLVSKKFSELTEEEKKMIPPPPPPRAKKPVLAPPPPKTGFHESNGKKLYYVQKGKSFTFYNKYGQIVTKEGKVINPEQTKSTNVIPGQNINKVYKDSKVVAEFKRSNLPPPPPKANFPEVKKGEISNIPPPATKTKRNGVSNIPPPPPPISAGELVFKYPNATFYFDNKKVSHKKVTKLVKKKKGLSVLTEEKDGKKVIKFTTKDYIEKGLAYVNNQTLFYTKKDGKKEYFNRWGKSVDKNGIIKPDNTTSNTKIIGSSTTKDNIEKGWIYVNDQTLYYTKKDGKKEYFNRWGKSVDKNGKEMKIKKE